MGAERIDALAALLEQTGEAHHVFETTELKGVYDEAWPQWYAAHAVEQGIAALVGRDVTADELAAFLASSSTEFNANQPQPTEPWAAYTARRIATEL